ncbi:MAG TPA: hypothetical protein VI168_07185 [Croceibacterium sp.]
MTAAGAARRPSSRVWSWVAAAALAAAAAIAADMLRTGSESAVPAAPAPPLDPAQLRPGYGPATLAEALGLADRTVAGARERLAVHPDEWLRMEALARALAARFRLSADPADLAEADRLLDRGLAAAPWPAGPALTRAAVSLTAHDFGGAEAALERFDASAVPPPAEEQAEARAIRCEIAFERGRLDDARRLCAGDTFALELRRANLAAKTGDPGEAVQIVESLLRQPRLQPPTLATLALERASLALAQGDWGGAGQWARAAERVFPGYWLSEAFVAQQYALEGNRAEARRRYAALASNGNPDVLDALAVLAVADGQAAEARDWAERAGAAWEARSRMLPFAYASHHGEHELLRGDARRGLTLAEADYRRRPYPPAIVHYGFALWRTGEFARALEIVRKGEAAGFLTADMKLIEAVSLGSLGRAAEAGEAIAAARRLNPRIDSERQRFVAFGRD